MRRRLKLNKRHLSGQDRMGAGGVWRRDGKVEGRRLLALTKEFKGTRHGVDELGGKSGGEGEIGGAVSHS